LGRRSEATNGRIMANGRNLHQGKRTVDVFIPSNCKRGKTLDFMLSRRRDKAAARLFFESAIVANGVPAKVVIDKSGANLAGLLRINVGLKFSQTHRPIKILRVKYLNNIIEQDHRFIKKITRPTRGFKAFHSAAATLAGMEVTHMIRKKQIPTNHASPFESFASLAA